MAKVSIPDVQAEQTKLAAMKSKRARIFIGLKDLLETITKDNGYTQSVQEVTFDVKGWQDKASAETPVIYVIDDTTTVIRSAGCKWKFMWTLRIFGVMREADMLEFEEFISDMEECIFDNNTLFGQVNKMEVIQISTDNQLFSELDGTHLFEIELLMEFTRGARDPR